MGTLAGTPGNAAIDILVTKGNFAFSRNVTLFEPTTIKTLGAGPVIGSGATPGTVTLTGTAITALAVASAGSGYTVAPTVSISGTGTGAIAVANVTGGFVTSI